jgi:CRISPR associated protein Cas1
MTSVGLDPGIPVGLHAFQRGRASGALDVLEPARPVYEAVALSLIDETVFSRRDFAERPDGSILIGPVLIRRLLDAMPLLGEAVAPIVEQVAQQLADGADLGTLATPLTEANRRQSREATRRRSRRSPARSPVAPRRCAECGADLAAGQRELCTTCQAVANQARLDAYRTSQAARRRKADQPATATAATRGRIADSQRAQWHARRGTEPAGGFTGHPSEFRRLIQPKLAARRPSDLARATGLSPGYCAQVRDGQRVPHPRHWAAFQLAGLDPPDDRAGNCIAPRPGRPRSDHPFSGCS